MTANLPFSTAALLLTLFSGAAAANAQGPDLRGDAASWQTVLDGVMGGRSTGKVQQDANGNLVFSGDLSLENNGGFSQMRRAVDGEVFAGTNGVTIECRGDGRTYNFDLRVANARMMAGGFQESFATKDGEWTTIDVPFAQFELYSFGRKVRRAPELQPRLIESLGVTLSDKKPGPFRLEIRSVRPMGSGGAGRDTGRAAGNDGTTSGNDLVSVAKSAGLTTLLDAVTAAGIELPDAPVTIFAPTNEAFASLPEGTLAKLLEPESKGALRQILGFHIVAGARTSADVLNSRTLTTSIGQRLKVDAQAGRIGGAGIAAVDVPFDGGIVHVIDQVLLPEQRSIVEIAVATEQLSTLVTAVKAAGLVDQLGRENGPWTVFAPVDSAFAALPEGTVAKLLESENRRTLISILGLHVVPGRIAASELLAKKRLTSLMGQPIATGLDSGKITVGGATIVTADIPAQNGVIHLIDTVILPKADDAVDATEAAARVAPGRPVTDLREAAKALYTLAIERGARQFNEGNAQACGDIYEVTIESVLQLAGNRLPQAVRERFEEARRRADAAGSPRSRAWTLRRALDDTYQQLERLPARQREELEPRRGER